MLVPRWIWKFRFSYKQLASCHKKRLTPRDSAQQHRLPPNKNNSSGNGAITVEMPRTHVELFLSVGCQRNTLDELAFLRDHQLEPRNIYEGSAESLNAKDQQICHGNMYSFRATRSTLNVLSQLPLEMILRWIEGSCLTPFTCAWLGPTPTSSVAGGKTHSV